MKPVTKTHYERLLTDYVKTNMTIEQVNSRFRAAGGLSQSYRLRRSLDIGAYLRKYKKKTFDNMYKIYLTEGRVL